MNIYPDLNNKVVVITGGNGFLGRQYSEAFLKQGSKVIILDKKPSTLIKGKNLFYYNADITNENKIVKISKQILKKFNQIDILINNACNDYIPKKSKNKFNESFNIKQIKKDLVVGLVGAIICTKIFGSIFNKKKTEASIINISSDLGIISPNQEIYSHLNFLKPVSYSIVKHGIIGLTKYSATLWKNKKIRTNCVALGGMKNNQEKNFLKKIKKLIPLQRLANKFEYNNLILFLGSNSSSYINGSTIVSDGGRTII